jgi:hypothetical protein
MTYNEKSMWKRIPYLWANMSKQYFNPFDKKSSYRNIKDSIQSFVDPHIEKKPRGVKEISELIDTDQIKLNLSISRDDKLPNDNLNTQINDSENQIEESLNRRI